MYAFARCLKEERERMHFIFFNTMNENKHREVYRIVERITPPKESSNGFFFLLFQGSASDNVRKTANFRFILH